MQFTREGGWNVAERIEDLEQLREQFMHELQQSQPNLAHQDDYMRYWRAVEREAGQTDDLGKLENWVRGLARDKEQIQALKQRAEESGPEHEGMAIVLQVLRMILEMLEGVEKRIRRHRDERRAVLAALLWAGGPGTKPKDDQNDDKKKEETKQTSALLDQQAQKQAPPKVEAKKEDKKMQR